MNRNLSLCDQEAGFAPNLRHLHPLHSYKQAENPHTADLMASVQIQPSRLTWDTSERKPAPEQEITRVLEDAEIYQRKPLLKIEEKFFPR